MRSIEIHVDNFGVFYMTDFCITLFTKYSLLLELQSVYIYIYIYIYIYPTQIHLSNDSMVMTKLLITFNCSMHFYPCQVQKKKNTFIKKYPVYI